MKTSGAITKDYVKYGEAIFNLKGKEYKLNIYQSIDLAKQRKYRDYLLFLSGIRPVVKRPMVEVVTLTFLSRRVIQS